MSHQQLYYHCDSIYLYPLNLTLSKFVSRISTVISDPSDELVRLIVACQLH
jgi:hypothetical protein